MSSLPNKYLDNHPFHDRSNMRSRKEIKMNLAKTAPTASRNKNGKAAIIPKEATIPPHNPTTNSININDVLAITNSTQNGMYDH